MCILNLCVSLFSPPSKFSQKLFFPQGELLLFSIELNSFVFPWFFIFSYPLLCMFIVCLLIGLSLSIHDKKGGEIDEIWEILFKRFLNCFIKRVMKLFLKGRENKSFYFLFFMYRTQGEESQFTCFLIFCYCIFVICCLSIVISTHALMCSCGCFRKDRYILIKTFCLFLQLLGQKSQIGIYDVFGKFIVIGLFLYLSISFCM